MAMFGALPAMSAAAPGAMEQMRGMMPKRPAGMFGAGKGNVGEIIGALLSGFSAAQGNPAGMAGLQMLHQRRQQEAEAQQYGQRREDEFQDFVRKEAYKAANPSAVNNDTVADYNFWKGVLPPDQFQQYVANKVNPPQLMNVPGVGIVQVPRMGGMQAPSAPVGKLTPIDEGGPMPSASGGFPRPY